MPSACESVYMIVCSINAITGNIFPQAAQEKGKERISPRRLVIMTANLQCTSLPCSVLHHIPNPPRSRSRSMSKSKSMLKFISSLSHGNTVLALLSVASKSIMSIPVVLMGTVEW
jgi:hypothetical protein